MIFGFILRSYFFKKERNNLPVIKTNCAGVFPDQSRRGLNHRKPIAIGIERLIIQPLTRGEEGILKYIERI